MLPKGRSSYALGVEMVSNAQNRDGRRNKSEGKLREYNLMVVNVSQTRKKNLRRGHHSASFRDIERVEMGLGPNSPQIEVACSQEPEVGEGIWKVELVS